MNYATFEKSGVEVLRLGMQRNDCADWPIEHWQTHSERWRLFSPAIDGYMNAHFAGKEYGGNVAGLLLTLEIADFRAWPIGPFHWGVRRVSFMRSSRQIGINAQLMWPEIGKLTLTNQFKAYAEAVLASVDELTSSKKIPRDFDVKVFWEDLLSAFEGAKPSQLTKTRFFKRNV